jgi:hypothetical protein
MSIVLSVVLFAGVLFAGMLLLQEAGRRLGARRMARDPEGARTGLGAVEGAVFGLMGLMIAFTFSGAASRFETRRQLIVEEANAIVTAYLRLDLLPADAQPKLKELFRRYLDARLEAYRRLPDIPAAKDALAQSTALQGEIWTASIEAGRASPQATMLLLPALNAMIDITTTRTVALQTHPPEIIFAMLGLLAFACALLAGYGMAGTKSRSLVHSLGFAIILTLTVYVVLDLEYPRVGLIRINAVDQVLMDVRQSMK